MLKKIEVKLAKKGTLIAEFQKERTDAITEMFDNVDDIGIYPTSKFFMRLDNAVGDIIWEQHKNYVEKIRKELVKLYCPEAMGFEGPETFPDCGKCIVCKAKNNRLEIL